MPASRPVKVSLTASGTLVATYRHRIQRQALEVLAQVEDPTALRRVVARSIGTAVVDQLTEAIAEAIAPSQQAL